MRDATQVLIRPLLTEKSTELLRLNKYTFEVAPNATKVDIQRAIESLGQCQVEKVNTLVVKGKTRRTRRGTGRTPDWKKAIITLKEGSTMSGFLGEVFEGMTP
jgi:large subunit ribosomal protein L23